MRDFFVFLLCCIILYAFLDLVYTLYCIMRSTVSLFIQSGGFREVRHFASHCLCRLRHYLSSFR